MIQYLDEKIANYEVCVILPSSYDQSKKYRTIYMHDGGETAMQAANYIDHLILSGQIEPLIVIGIEPINRNNDYTPWEAPSLAPHASTFEGQAQIYLHTVVTEIKPYIDAHYATNPEPSHTAISGCSLGGLVSIFASYYYPEVFHQYISLSASFWYEDVLRYLQGEKIERQGNIHIKPTVNRQNHQLYLYVGELEGILKKRYKGIWLPTRRKPTLNLSRKAIWNLIYYLRQIQKELMMTYSLLTTSFSHFVGYLA